jgi:hypothetical protein
MNILFSTINYNTLSSNWTFNEIRKCKLWCTLIFQRCFSRHITKVVVALMWSEVTIASLVAHLLWHQVIVAQQEVSSEQECWENARFVNCGVCTLFAARLGGGAGGFPMGVEAPSPASCMTKPMVGCSRGGLTRHSGSPLRTIQWISKARVG